MTVKNGFVSIFFILSLVNNGNASANPDPGKLITPFKIAGNLYFIGDSYVASYLVATPSGNILINSDYPSDVLMLKDNIEKLGFSYKETKILLISHAHADHSGGSAQIKKETGATYMVMEPDVSVVESGGKTDFQYGNSHDLDNFYPATKVDKVLHDGDKVKLGGAVLVAHLTAGHTKGCTTWTMTVKEKGKRYDVVIVGGAYVNPGTQLVNNAQYPAIAKDYQHGFTVLKSLPCDIFLGAHGLYFNLDKKIPLMNKQVANPFIDSQGYKAFVAKKERDFNDELAKQQ